MKKQVIQALKTHKHTFISGQELSDQIGVSRTAVWKHIKQLKEEGYEIESVSRKGYRLLKEPDTLDENVLAIELQNQLIGKHIHHYDSVDSTNTVAKELASKGANEGTVVIAEEQVGGRGRLGRVWQSPKGTGIWMSIILRPCIEPTEAAKITQITAAGVLLGLKRVLGDDVGIKWPNDIIIHKKKVCGILTEMSAELNGVNYIVVGIGINVNVDIDTFSEDVQKIATSVKACVHHEVSRKDIVKSVLSEFEKLYFNFLETKSIKESIEICKKYSVTLGKEVKIKSKNEETIAYALDLTEDGQLVIKNASGEVQTVLSGEVSVRGLTDYV